MKLTVFADIAVSFGPDGDGPGTPSERGIVRMVEAYNAGSCDVLEFEDLMRSIVGVRDRRPVAVTVPHAHHDRLSHTQRIDVEWARHFLWAAGFLAPELGRTVH